MLLAGKAYLEATGALKILSISLVFSIVATYMTHVVLLPFKRETNIMFATFASAALNALLNLFFIPHYMHFGAAFTTLLAEFIVMIWQIIVARKLPHAKPKKRNFILVIAGCIIIAIICSLVNLLGISYLAKLALKVLLSVVCYSVTLIIGKHTIVYEILGKVIKKHE